MGTDIHGIFQRRTQAGKWEDVTSEYSFDRHYFLFSFLAGVRNGRGFAGVKTYAPITPIAEPRGLPSDFEMVGDDHPIAGIEFKEPWTRRWAADHPEDKEENNIWMGDHSHSWVTGEEIIAQALRLGNSTHTGVVDVSWFRDWDHKTAPEAYSDAVYGDRVVVVNDGQSLIGATHVRIWWKQDDAEDIKYFLDEVERLMKEHGEIRFVFGFDS